MPDRVCVYTVLTGGYETLNEQPVASDSAIPFLCLTDDPDIASSTWRIVPVTPLFAMDSVRSQRDLKLRPHVHLPDYDSSVYIDNTVILSQPPERLLEAFDTGRGMAVLDHQHRHTVWDEFVAVIEGGFDDQARVLEQLNHFMIACPEVLEEKPFATFLLLRDHANPAVRRAMELWAAHVHRYSRRDQLSANRAFGLAGLSPQRLDMPMNVSPFHSWPRTAGRKPRSFGLERAPPAMQIARLESALADETRKRQALEQEHAQLRRWRKKLERKGLIGTRTRTGAWILADPGDKRARRLISTRGNLNPATLAMWHLILGRGTWTDVVDVGANYGEMLVNGGLPQGARVVAVEPNPRIRRYLRRSLAVSGIEARIVPAAASDSPGRTFLEIDLRWSGRSQVEGARKSPPECRRIPVRTTTLARILCRKQKPERVSAAVKIDVEGHEISVLEGVLDILPRLAGFAALIESTHLSDEDRTWLLARFEIEVFDVAGKRLVPVIPATVERLDDLLAGDDYYAHDIVLRRKASAAGSKSR